MSVIAISLLVAACIFSGGMAGLYFHRFLPPNHQTKETQDVVRLGIGMLSVLASLVLGLLIATAKRLLRCDRSRDPQLRRRAGAVERDPARLRRHRIGAARPAAQLHRAGVAGRLAHGWWTRNEREVKRLRPLVAAINDLEPGLQQLSDTELAQKTVEFKQRIANGEPLDDLLIESFAVCREAGRRVLNMRHFDVQLIGGAVLHRGRIAEMRTGEGKTLVATLPCYLNALEGKGVHVVTVNDYLAKRDAEWMGRIYRFLGLSYGIIVHDLDDQERHANYAADITYGTNNEYGFDYLRDNMKFRLEDCAQRGHNFAIVDEVDSILVDEARTPLIISGPSEESTDKYYKINRIIPKLTRGEEIKGKEPGESYTTGDYTVDEKHRSAALTEEGIAKVEKMLGCGNLYQPENWSTLHHVQQALKALVLFQRDKDYLVQDGQVIIVDEFTGRVMPGRRWSDGLHQAIEAKENVKIERENQTLATITFQNYFRLYKKLAGMTGTAETEAAEFEKTYKLDVMVIPTNRAMVRKEFQDMVYRTEEEKFRNAAKEIQTLQRKGPAGSGGHHLGRKIRKAGRAAEEDGRQARSVERQESRARSVHHRAGRAARTPSRCPPTWPAAAPTFCWVAIRNSSPKSI